MKRVICLLLTMTALALRAQVTTKTMTPNETNQTALATLGGGCFWCTEAQIKLLPGVLSVESGFAGGHTEYPTYEDVCGGDTGHAEVIQITYDPRVISYQKIIDEFWYVHDPTTLNRQGADSGTQYRSIILYRNDAEKKIAEDSLKAAQAHYSKPIVTQIVPLKKFYKAELYHQDYYQNNPENGYCQFVIRPKVEKFEKKLKQEQGAAH